MKETSRMSLRTLVYYFNRLKREASAKSFTHTLHNGIPVEDCGIWELTVRGDHHEFHIMPSSIIWYGPDGDCIASRLNN